MNILLILSILLTPAPQPGVHVSDTQGISITVSPRVELIKRPTIERLPELAPILPTYTATPKAPQATVAIAPTAGSCADWIVAAGITDVASANELIRRESGCNPNAVNRSTGACGVAQELPCGKSGCARGDGACQVRWMNGYVINRYKSWAEAVRFHNVNNWY